MDESRPPTRKRARREEPTDLPDELIASTRLLDLPDELIVRILSLCAANAQRCALARTCRRVRALAWTPEAGWLYFPLRLAASAPQLVAHPWLRSNSTSRATTFAGERDEGGFGDDADARYLVKQHRFSRVRTLRVSLLRSSTSASDDAANTLRRVLEGASFRGSVTDVYAYVYELAAAGEGEAPRLREVEPSAAEMEAVAAALPALRSVFCPEGSLRSFAGLAAGGGGATVQQLLSARHTRAAAAPWSILRALFPHLRLLSNALVSGNQDLLRLAATGPPAELGGRPPLESPAAAAILGRPLAQRLAAAAVPPPAAAAAVAVGSLTLRGADLTDPAALDAARAVVARGARFLSCVSVAGLAPFLSALAAAPAPPPFAAAAAAACPSDAPAAPAPPPSAAFHLFFRDCEWGPAESAALAALGPRVEALSLARCRLPAPPAPEDLYGASRLFLPAAAALAAAAALPALRQLAAECPGPGPEAGDLRGLLRRCPLLADLALSGCGAAGEGARELLEDRRAGGAAAGPDAPPPFVFELP